MAGLNKIMLIGNLGGDPEIRYSANNNAIATFSLATTERRKDRDGEWGDQTEWHRIVMFGRQAEIAEQYLRKGKQIYLEGRIQYRKWTDRDGNQRTSTEIVAYNFLMLSRSGDMNDNGYYDSGRYGRKDRDRNYNNGNPKKSSGFDSQSETDVDFDVFDTGPSGNVKRERDPFLYGGSDNSTGTHRDQEDSTDSLDPDGGTKDDLPF